MDDFDTLRNLNPTDDEEARGCEDCDMYGLEAGLAGLAGLAEKGEAGSVQGVKQEAGERAARDWRSTG